MIEWIIESEGEERKESKGEIRTYCFVRGLTMDIGKRRLF